MGEVTMKSWFIGFLISIVFWVVVVLWEKMEFMKLERKLKEV